MKTITLHKYLETRSQQDAASLLGCGQTAISLAVREGRRVYLEFDIDGTFVRAYEIARFPRRGGAEAA